MSETAPPPRPRAIKDGLRARVITAGIAAPVTIGAVLLPGGWAFLVLLATVLVLSYREAFRLMRGMLVIRAATAFSYVMPGVTAFALLRIAPPGTWPELGWLEPGSRMVLSILFATWAGDSAAFFIGRSFGRHKLAPRLSPGKTWEGALSNLFASVVVAICLGKLFMLGTTWSIGIGFVVGVLGQAGDLLESALKRRVGVKDSGLLLPGHGGILDRVDSLLVSAPVSLAWTWLVGTV